MDVKKDLNYYLSLPYTIQLHPDPTGGYAISILELPGCISQRDNVQDALQMIEDAKIGWLEIALEDGDDIPEPNMGESYSGKFLLRMPVSLQKILTQQARREKVSLNQLINYQLAKSIGQKKRL